MIHIETGGLGSYAFKITDWVSFDASFIIKKKVSILNFYADIRIEYFLYQNRLNWPKRKKLLVCSCRPLAKTTLMEKAASVGGFHF